MAVTIAESRKGLPFPAFLELLLMQLTFELLIEAGIRLPGIIGQTLGIVGALIIGDAAVRAGLVSPTVTVFVALAGVGSFAMPSYNMAISLRIVRLFLILLAGSFGFFGMMMGLLLVLAHLLNLRSFGLPCLSPFGILTLPRTSVEKVGPDAWLSIILGGLLSVLGAIFIIKLGLRFPQRTLVEYNPIIYDRSLWKCFFWVPWYPLIFFCLMAITAVWTMPKGLFGKWIAVQGSGKVRPELNKNDSFYRLPECACFKELLWFSRFFCFRTGKRLGNIYC